MLLESHFFNIKNYNYVLQLWKFLGNALDLADSLNRFYHLDFCYPVGSSVAERQKYTPVDILKKRFASGEITKAEFEEMKEILKKD